MSSAVQESMSKVIAKSWQDPAYKQQLLKDPKGTLASAGIVFPEGHNVQIHESDSQTTHLSLPPKPATLGTEKELVEEAAPSASQIICVCVSSRPGKKDLICVGPKH